MQLLPLPSYVWKDLIFPYLDGCDLAKLRKTCKTLRQLTENNRKIAIHYVFTTRQILAEKLLFCRLHRVPIDLTVEILKQEILYPTEGMKLTCDHTRNEFVLVNNFHAYDHYQHSHWDKVVEYLTKHGFHWILYEYKPTPNFTTSIGLANENEFIQIGRGSCFYISWPINWKKKEERRFKRLKM